MTQPNPGEEQDPAAIAGQERISEPVVRTGMFGTATTGDTSGYGGLMVRQPPSLSTPAAVRLLLR